MLMGHSVEGRFPFLDCDVVDFANGLPAHHKLLGLDEKHVLKRAFEDVLPETILRRPKQPYRAPDAASFFAGPDNEWVLDLLEASNVRKSGLFSEEAVSKLAAKCRRGAGRGMSNTDNMRVVGLISTLLVHDLFIQDGAEASDSAPPEPMKVVDRTAE